MLEEIVGDITDEFDVEEISYSKFDENTFIMEGKTALIDFYRVLELDENSWEEAKGESDTLGGFIMEQAGKILRKGEYINFENLKLSIDAGDNRKIDRVKIELIKEIKMTGRTKAFVFASLVSFCFSSCSESPIPRPKGYQRINIP